MTYVRPALLYASPPVSTGADLTAPVGELPLVHTTRHLLDITALAFDAPVLDVRAGWSLLVPELLAHGYANLIAADASATALLELRQQLPPEQVARVLWVVDDLDDPHCLFRLEPVLLWHDPSPPSEASRDPQSTNTYWHLLRYMVGARGWVLLGGERPAELAAFLGPDYQLRLVLKDVSFSLPGETPATYALFQRNNTSRQGPWAVAAAEPGR